MGFNVKRQAPIMYLKVRRVGVPAPEYWAVDAKAYGHFRGGVLILDGNRVVHLLEREYIVTDRRATPPESKFEFNFLNTK